MHDLAAELDKELTSFAHHPQTGKLVLGALGITANQVTGERVVRAYYLSPGNEVFRFFALTRGGFHVAEMNTSGVQLVVVVPLERIRRVLERDEGETVTVTVEIDADVQRSFGRWEGRSGNVDQNDFDRGNVGQFELTSSSATYTVQSGASDTDHDKLRRLALGLRNAIADGR